MDGGGEKVVGNGNFSEHQHKIFTSVTFSKLDIYIY
jgi:hypothetical protein